MKYVLPSILSAVTAGNILIHVHLLIKMITLWQYATVPLVIGTIMSLSICVLLTCINIYICVKMLKQDEFNA